jgi:hypothetical protein
MPPDSPLPSPDPLDPSRSSAASGNENSDLYSTQGGLQPLDQGLPVFPSKKRKFKKRWILYAIGLWLAIETYQCVNLYEGTENYPWRMKVTSDCQKIGLKINASTDYPGTKKAAYCELFNGGGYTEYTGDIGPEGKFLYLHPWWRSLCNNRYGGLDFSLGSQRVNQTLDRKNDDTRKFILFTYADSLPYIYHKGITRGSPPVYLYPGIRPGSQVLPNLPDTLKVACTKGSCIPYFDSIPWGDTVSIELRESNMAHLYIRDFHQKHLHITCSES